MPAHVTIPQPARRLSAMDASFLHLERPRAPLHIGCVVCLEGALSIEALVRHLEHRLPGRRRWAERLAAAPLGLAHPSWVAVPDFEPQDHVQRWRLPEPGGERELREVVGALLARPLEKDRPLWEAHLLEGLANGDSAVLLKVHHCMVDGMAGASLLDSLLEERPRARRRPTPRRPIGAAPAHEAEPASSRRLADTLADAVAAPVRAARDATGLLGALGSPGRLAGAAAEAGGFAWRAAHGERPAMPWNGDLGPRRRLAFARLSLLDARWIRSAHGGTVNDVVLTALAGGLRRHLAWAGVPIPGGVLHALVPVSLRTPHEASALGNRLAALRVPLALGPDRELDRLAATCRVTERLKAARRYEGIAALLAAIDWLPAPLVAFAAGRLPWRALAHLLATNVPGPRTPRFLAGRPVRALYPIAPLVHGMGLALAVFSYAGWLHVGLHADPDRVPELEKLRVGIEESFAALRAGL
jgi:diacylglycerol O-acyltransferase